MSPAPSPKRVQLRRTKGWRKPSGVVSVARPTKWGNPYPVSDRVTPAQAVASYEMAVRCGYDHVPDTETIQAELRGRDLACWCPAGQECHADVLLRIANEQAPD